MTGFVLFSFVLIKGEGLGMAQRLRALVAHPEELSFELHMAAHNRGHALSKGPDAFFMASLDTTMCKHA